MMSVIDTDDEDLLLGAYSDDYVILDRPQELLDLQRNSSAHPDIKSSSDSFKWPAVTTEVKKIPVEKVKGKKLICRRDRKVSSKNRLPYKPLSAKSSKKRAGLNNQFDTLLEKAKISLAKHKSGSSKTESSKEIIKNDLQISKAIGEPPVTAQQRYQALEIRDTALRTERDAKQSGTKKPKVIGCCPDMCPEKERYGRIWKNCLSVLEIKTVFDEIAKSRDADHSFMVKEYSRSSADQQEPLPHELRPISVLRFTMDYLICNIMDIPLDNITLADWYDFIWNRTRSIRKDITQQQLCDVQCVDIIEKCVRFHIHCAEAMSEEDLSTFDPKINNENLTKCLQTLKHMYHDLESKGIQCPNEAEFRAYDILLSLTEGETLRLVKDIRKDLLKTPVIRSAFEAALAFKSNNYVKFFKIFERADYLSSCILHRYISEARIGALQVIVRAYATQQNSSMYPISDLVRDLKFESASEALELCKSHGLDATEDYIVIDRRQFIKFSSDSSLSRRSFSLVGIKMKEFLGEVVNNGSLPVNPLDWYQPHDSFGDPNLVKPDSLAAVPTIEEQHLEEKDIQNDVAMEEVSVENQSHTITSSVSPRHKVKLKNAELSDLKRARSHLLSEINKLQHLSETRIKDLKSTSTKISQRKKDKHSHKSHKSVMFSDDSVVSQPESGIELETHQEFTVVVAKNKEKTEEPVVSSKFSGAFGLKDVLHCSKSATVTKSVSDIFAKSVAVPESVVTTTTSSLFFRPTTLSSTCPFFSSPVYLSQISNIRTALPPSNLKKIFKSCDTAASLSSTNPPLKSPLAVSSSMFSFSSPVHLVPKIVEMECEELRTDEHSLPINKSKVFDSRMPTSVREPAKEIPYENLDNIVVEDFDDNADDISVKDFDKEMTEMTDENFDEEKDDIIEEGTDDFIENETDDIEEETDDIIKRRINNVMEEEIDDVIEEETDDIIEKEIIKVRHKKRQEDEVKEATESLASEMWESCVEEFCTSICEEVLTEEQRLAELEDECEMIRTELAKRAFVRWRLFCDRKRQRRHLQSSVFCSPWQPMLLNTPYVVTGVSNPLSVYRKHKKISHATAKKMKKLHQVSSGWDAFKTEEIWSFPKYKSTPAVYFGEKGIVHFFKLCLVFPSKCHGSDLPILLEWFCAKFNLSKSESSEFSFLNSFVVNDGESVISVRAVKLGTEMNKQYKKFLDGISAMLLCVPPFNDPKDRATFFNDVSNLLDFDSLMYPFPLYAFLSDSEENSGSELSFLSEKLDAMIFSDLKTTHLPEAMDFTTTSKEVLDSVKWLIGKKKSNPQLQKCDFVHFVEDSFTFVFNILFCKNSLEEFKLLKQMPQHIIAFYNLVMDFRANILCSELLQRLVESWPPDDLIKLYPDLKFIDKEQQLRCEKKMKELILPEFEGHQNSMESLWQYVESIAKLACVEKDMLVIRINHVLENSDESINWLSIINVCASHLMYVLHSPDPESSHAQDTSHIFYTKEDLESFECEDFWYDVLEQIRKFNCYKTKRKHDSLLDSLQKKQKCDVVLEEIICDSSSSKDANYFSNAFDMPDVFACQRGHLFSNLEAALTKQKQESDAFLQKLDETIISGSISNGIQQNHHENDNLAEEEVFSQDSSLLFESDISFPKFSSSQNSFTYLTTGTDWLNGSLVLKKSSSDHSLASLADKLSELKYNLQKSSILEDHFNQFLSKQV